VRRFLPAPGSNRSLVIQSNAIWLLGRLAPGTKYEARSVSAVLASLSRSSDPRLLEGKLQALGSFTNFPQRVVPVLVTGLTNTAAIDSTLLALQRFGTSATPALYPIALAETGFIRPAELALKKADPIAYERLQVEKASIGQK